MSAHPRVILVFLLFIALTACTMSIGVEQPQPPSSDQVATIVAMTLTASSPQTGDSLTSMPEAPASLLPHTFFYLSKDAGGLIQVFRIGRDGKTIMQLTYEEVDVTDYDVSLADGSVAYVANNQLSLVLADGSSKRVLIDGGPRESNAWLTNPVFSPDGRTIAYGYNGLNFYDLSTGGSKLAIADQVEITNGGQFETYIPERYSPDGTKLLVAMGHWEVAPSHAVYYPDQNELIRPTGGEGYIYCCSFYGGAEWSPDSSSFYGIASEHDYSFPHGALWKVDAATGAVTTLIHIVAKDGTMNLPYKPHLATDGQLYYFFLNYPEPSGDFGRLPLQLVRSAADNTTDRTVLRNETFETIEEALWAPDASFVVIVSASNQEASGDGQAEIVYIDGRPNVPLAQSAREMKWGP